MAFSYSDKNFTVVGNLCFVHTSIEKKGGHTYNIPSAIVERMLTKDVVFNYSGHSDGLNDYVTSYGVIKEGKIGITSPKDIAYLNFFFPIDSNK